MSFFDFANGIRVEFDFRGNNNFKSNFISDFTELRNSSVKFNQISDNLIIGLNKIVFVDHLSSGTGLNPLSVLGAGGTVYYSGNKTAYIYLNSDRSSNNSLGQDNIAGTIIHELLHVHKDV